MSNTKCRQLVRQLSHLATNNLLVLLIAAFAIGTMVRALASTPADALDAELKAAIAAAPNAADWPNSNYARLLDLANVNVRSDGTVVARYRLTYKLFNSRDRDRLAEVNLPYNSSNESIHVVSARTVRKDGSIVAVKPEDIRVTSPYSEFLMYDDALAISFSMPAVEDECIIDYTWEQTTRPMLLPGQFSQFWAFSGFEPVGTSRIVLHVPAGKKFNFHAYNDDTLKPVIVNSLDGKNVTYTWERTNIKPVLSEPSMPRVDLVTTWLEISSVSSWQDIATKFWALEHPQARATPEVKTAVATIIQGKTTDEEKARAIYDWVATSARYVGLEFGIAAYKPHAAAEVLAKRYGDCKDKATLLITMLGVAGIKAHPVLLHADERRVIDNGLPNLTAFDHCIALAEVSGKSVWLDATAETSPYGDIPMADRGVRALVVKDGVGEFTTIPMYSAEQNGTDVSSTVLVNQDGSAQIEMTITLNGEMSQQIRSAIVQRTPDQQKEMFQKMGQEFSTGAAVVRYTLPPASELRTTGSFKIKMELLAPNFAKRVGRLLIMPLEVGAGSRRQTNPFVNDIRNWPIVEEEPGLTRSDTVIKAPEGYTVEASPDDVTAACPIQQYERHLKISPAGTEVNVSSVVRSIPSIVPPAQYAIVRACYNSVLKTADDLIVLSKK